MSVLPGLMTWLARMTVTSKAKSLQAPQTAVTAMADAAEAAQPSVAAKAEESVMAITFKSVGHFLAKAYKAVVAELPKIEATKTEVEGATAAFAGTKYGPLAVGVEDAAYALLGEVSAALTSGGAAAEAKLTDAGLDANVVATVKAVAAGTANLTAVAKAL